VTDAPDGLRYSPDHLWIRLAPEGVARIGLTDFAQESLGDIIAVTMPNVGDDLEPGQACGDVESTKSVSDLVAPVRATVTATNGALEDQPDLVNSDPYRGGWLLEARLHSDAGVADLLDADAYGRLIGR